MAASAHRRAFGQGGLGSPATQLMRAVRRLLKCKVTPLGANVKMRGTISVILSLSLYIVPIWFFSAHKDKPIYSGYSIWYAIPLVAALVLTWILPNRDGRVLDTVSLIGLAALQVVVAYLLDAIVPARAFGRAFVEIGLAATVWMALALVVNRLVRVVSSNNGQYGPRGRVSAGVVFFALTVCFLVVISAWLVPQTRVLFADHIFFSFGLWTLFLVGSAGAVWFEDAFQLRIKGQGGRVAMGGDTADVIAAEVKTEIENMSKRLLAAMIVTNFGFMIVGLLAYLIAGHSAEWLALGAYFLGMVLSLLSALAGQSWYKHRWHTRIRNAGVGLEYYRNAAKGTALAFPEGNE